MLLRTRFKYACVCGWLSAYMPLVWHSMTRAHCGKIHSHTHTATSTKVMSTQYHAHIFKIPKMYTHFRLSVSCIVCCCFSSLECTDFLALSLDSLLRSSIWLNVSSVVLPMDFIKLDQKFQTHLNKVDREGKSEMENNQRIKKNYKNQRTKWATIIITHVRLSWCYLIWLEECMAL